MSGKCRILVGEDDFDTRNYLTMALQCQGFAVEAVEDGEEVIECLRSSVEPISLVLLDIIMPRKDGLEALRQIRKMYATLPVVMISSASSPSNVIEAMKRGANDFLAKPISHEELTSTVRKFAQPSIPFPPASEAHQTDRPNSTSPFLSGGSGMRLVETMIDHIADTDVAVLLQGETGVGKEIIARRIHGKSSRAGKPFLKLNCAALPSELLESELFGYERGAFTGAFKSKPGKFEQADEGTILLDEIGDMDFKLQAKLLHVLQDREFERLGGKGTVKVNVRIMAATHCNLEQAIAAGRFREDLYYRLSVLPIRIPPLRERQDEILPLSNLFLKKHTPPGRVLLGIPPQLRQALLDHTWPGNIRELENVMLKYIVLGDAHLIADDLRLYSRKGLTHATAPEPLQQLPATEETTTSDPYLADVEQTRQKAEAESLVAALNAANWNRKQAASILEIDEKILLYRMNKLGISEPLNHNGKSSEKSSLSADVPIFERLDQARKQAEAETITAALIKARWNRKQAAIALNLDYKALLYKMKVLGLSPSAAPVAHPDQVGRL
jgi:two-component system, NtrC family, response regulator AtoC